MLGDIIFFAYGGAETTVFDSQVTLFLKKLREAGIRSRLVAFQTLSDWLLRPDFWRKKKEEASHASGQDAVFLPRWPRDVLGLNTSALTRRLRRQGAPRLIHARGTQSAFMAVRLKDSFPGLKVIWDHRGLEAEEYLYIVNGEKKRPPNTMDWNWYSRLKRMESDAALGADSIFCVSEALKNFVIKEYGTADQWGEKITVAPGSVDLTRFSESRAQRSARRRELGIEGRFVLVYAGSIRAWQPASALAEALSAALTITPKAFLLALTPHVDAVVKELAGRSLPEGAYAALKTSHASTPSYLAAGDVGIMLRDDDIINRVASPTKTGEYLAAGNLILMSRSPEDAAAIIRRENAGVVLNHPWSLETLAGGLRRIFDRIQIEGESAREKAAAAAQSHYSCDRLWPLILAQYKRLLIL